MGVDNGGEWVSSLNSQIARLADEIGRRSTTQQTIQAASLSASTALAGVVISGHSSALLLLLLPMLSVALGYQWLDHHRAIQRMGLYLHTTAEPALEVQLGDAPKTFDFWETFIRRNNVAREGAWAWTLPILGVFHGSAILALVVVFQAAMIDPGRAVETSGLSQATIEFWPRLLWIVDAVITVLALRQMWKGLFQAPGAQGG